MMKKETLDAKPLQITYLDRLTFFKGHLTRMNTERIRFNRTKSIVRYVTKAQTKPWDLTLLDAPLGIMSFSIYYLRLGLNLSFLFQQLQEYRNGNIESMQSIQNVSLSVLNDSVWGTCNMIQYFWWTFRTSRSAGLRGMQLEVIGQLMDVLLIIIRHKQAFDQHQAQWAEASDAGRERLMMEWKYQQRNFIRVCLHLSLFTSVMALMAFSAATIPLSPIFFFYQFNQQSCADASTME